MILSPPRMSRSNPHMQLRRRSSLDKGNITISALVRTPLDPWLMGPAVGGRRPMHRVLGAAGYNRKLWIEELS